VRGLGLDRNEMERQPVVLSNRIRRAHRPAAETGAKLDYRVCPLGLNHGFE